MPNSPVAPENLRGMNLINSPIWNKGTAFTLEERDAFALEGLLPPYVETLEQQVARAYAGLRPDASALEKHIYLRGLQDTNEVLFYRLLLDYPEELLPLVYKPTTAEASQKFTDIYRRPRGIFISYPLRDRIPELLRSRPYAEVDIMVVTDGEHVLGIGDAGVNGLSVPIGKLSLYSLFGGIHPSRTLPIMLDVGTNNQELLKDPGYLGWRHERVSGQEYFDFLDQFIQAVKQELPGTCLQWEDFLPAKAETILDRYQNQIPTFNDNLQGSAAITLGTLLSAFRAADNVVRNGEFVFYGTGPEALKAADYLRRQMENEGLSPADTWKRIWFVDQHGLLHDGRRDPTSAQQKYAQPWDRISSWGKDLSLGTLIKNVKASALLGFGASKAVFTEEIIREMVLKSERPIILPLSSVTNEEEASPEDLIRWTRGKGLIASGTQTAAVSYYGRRVGIAHFSTAYIAPAVGLGFIASRAGRVTDGMMMAAARALAEQSPTVDDPNAPLLPEIRNLRRAALEVAIAVGCEAQNEGLTSGFSEAELRQEVEDTHWRPEYPALVPALTA